MGTVSGKGTTVKRKRYSRKFQRMAVARMETCEDVGELARELGCDRGASTSGAGSWRWLNQDKKRHGPARTHLLIARNPSLEAAFGRQDPGGGFFKGALQKIEARRQRNSGSGEMHLRPDPRSDVIAR